MISHFDAFIYIVSHLLGGQTIDQGLNFFKGLGGAKTGQGVYGGLDGFMSKAGGLGTQTANPVDGRRRETVSIAPGRALCAPGGAKFTGRESLIADDGGTAVPSYPQGHENHGLDTQGDGIQAGAARDIQNFFSGGGQIP
ncbi:MAG: hypothetical protein ACYDIC_01160 [Desulfobaccales bacterium]